MADATSTATQTETTEPESKLFGANRATVFEPEPPPDPNPGLLPWQRGEQEPEPEEEGAKKEGEEQDDADAGGDDDSAGSGEGDEDSEGTQTAGEGDDSAEEGGDASDNDSSDGTGDEGGDGEEDGAGEEEEPAARRPRLDARSRREMRFNEQRAERATQERDTARAELELMKARFAKLAENPLEAEKLQEEFAEEDKRRAEQATTQVAHVPTDDDKDWLRMTVVEMGGVKREDADKLVRELEENEPKLITAVRDLADPITMLGELAKLQEENPSAYAEVVSGSPNNVFRKLSRAEDAILAQAALAEEQEKEAKKAKPKPKPKKQAKPKDPVDKPDTGGSTPPKAKEKGASGYVDEQGTEWVSLPKKFASWEASLPPRPTR